MKASRVVQIASVLAVLAMLGSSPAVAEPGPAEASEPTSSNLPRDEWRYGTYYIYPLTRHIEESGVTGSWRFALYPITAVMDTAQLPFGALAGLFGD